MEVLCKLEYRDFSTEHGYGTELVRCIPNEGVWLYEIKATYATNIPSTTYYYLGRDLKEAKARFAKAMPWMRVTSIRLISPGEEAEQILTDKLRMPKR